MAVEWEQVVIQAMKPGDLARWWLKALGWVLTIDSDDEIEIRSHPDFVPGIVFLQATSPKVAQNRLHLDFRPDDQSVEVERLLKLGARRIDVGQGKASWVVMADPEGNEFCVLSTRRE
ncbi:MAG TPA: VOC family protein [Acidimicrobiales bacterium]